ncbi:ABC transporter ATP-binding protein [Amycolatopsis keratiniphila]|uniref:ABC transporter ATP-binding protein n=1 Tax=Amycolatopsis keratiniphila TaxID=129921 RepID=UPI00087D5FA3|nr:ATP-binding cassette domain-containing protein [Amycolatopsis keratiniphila]OLZ42942.1 ABC transporter ATP-binding protein [Amycolatopsis keratiniphila subsp. nogabecina]SDU66310.1 phospholipid/cholesterol/gamma-HCH transport system ATP-binding protein [Amycolatopsis keratiniphila]
MSTSNTADAPTRIHTRSGHLLAAAADRTHSMEVRNVSKAFGNFHVMRGMNINFADDAITTVLGPSGTGKSVLLKHLVGLLEPDKGEIIVFGQDLWKITEQERYDIRKRFGVLFQDGALFGSMNIYDNTAFPLRKHTDMSEAEIEHIVMTRLTEVGLERSITKLPNEVSGGMRKRAGFARALVLNPDIVLFDEPDSGLDPVRTSLLNDLILDMHREHKGTYLLVTHDIRTARKVSDYVGLIWQGQVVHYGEAEEAFASDDPFVRQFLAGESAGPLGMD